MVHRNKIVMLLMLQYTFMENLYNKILCDAYIK